MQNNDRFQKVKKFYHPTFSDLRSLASECSLWAAWMQRLGWLGWSLAVIWASYFDNWWIWTFCPTSAIESLESWSEAGWLPWPPKSRLRCSGLGFKNFVQDGMYLGKMKLCALLQFVACKFFCQLFSCVFLKCCLIRCIEQSLENLNFSTYNEKSNNKTRVVSHEGFHHFTQVSGNCKFRLLVGHLALNHVRIR